MSTLIPSSSMAYTLFADVKAQTIQRMTGTWGDIVHHIESTPEQPRKETCPLLKLASFGDGGSQTGSLRTDKNVLTICGIEGDYDGEVVSPADAAEKLTSVGVEAYIYTTASHTPEKPRWRVLAPLSHAYPPEKRHEFVERLNGVLDGLLARESYTLSQSYYFGKVRGVEYQTYRTHGRPIDCLDGQLMPIRKGVVLSGPHNDSDTPEPRTSDEELIRQITSGDEYHAALRTLSARYWARGMTSNAIIDTLRGCMQAATDRSPRWQDRFDNIPRLVAGAMKKFSGGPRGGIQHGRGDIQPLTEVGNAERLKIILGGRAKFVSERALWILWEERWTEDSGRSGVTEAAKQITHTLYREADSLLASGQAEDAQKVLQWALRGQTLKMLNATIDLVSRIPEMRLTLTRLDANPMIVGVNEARHILDLQRGCIRPAAPDDLVTRSLGVSELGDVAEAVTWRRFLKDVFESDGELIDWVQRWCGYLLTGHIREQCLLFLYGTGKNGKSVFISTLMTILGDYAKAISSETLVSSKRDSQSASPDLARLAGARLVTSGETEDGQILAESFVKSLTGGDRMVARYLHKDPFEFDPSFKLMIAGNHKPVIRGIDTGIWRRIYLVPFTKMFGDDEADPLMGEKLRAEAPHILAWMLEGCQSWQQEGLGKPPRRVVEATLEYREAMDTIGEFLAEQCELVPEAFVTAGELFSRYDTWSRQCGLRPPTRQGFGRKIAERPGITAVKRGSRRGYVGVRLRDGWTESEES
ncbi:MAG: phage/plasmid primase, P4 family [Nitrospira sp.]|nr:phage/plasmid primase, P4 family [Nitrospira sp.]